MINFPVGAGTSGHLVGSALLTYTLGPPAASIVMTAILAIQALVFQDGGVLALGANLINMAVVGVLAAYLPYRVWGGARLRRPAIFLGGALSLLAGASLAIAQLLLSGVPMPAGMLGISLALFGVAAFLEGAITLAVVEALERINPQFVQRPQARGGRAIAALGLAAVVLAVIGVLFASAHPDGLERLAGYLGIAGRAEALISSPFADYEFAGIGAAWPRKALAGLAGLALIYVACLAFGRLISRRRRA
jgi:cobalt/nickel transport system permease protein